MAIKKAPANQNVSVKGILDPMASSNPTTQGGLIASNSVTSRIPPLPGGSDEYQRRNQARKRIRLLTGLWLPDLMQHLQEHFNSIRIEAIGKPDLATNLLLAMDEQLSVLYATRQLIYHDGLSADQMEEVYEILGRSGWFSMAREHQMNVLAIQESLFRPSTTESGLLLRMATPDMLVASAPTTNPDIPDRLVEARLRTIKNARGEPEQMWTWDEYDVRDKENPTYRILTASTEEGQKDITALVTGEERSGEMYPYRWTQDDPSQHRKAGDPYLPYSLYHAKRTGKLWNGMAGLEVVEGTLTVAVLWTYWLHNVKDAAWQQKYSIDAFLRGVGDDGANLHDRRETVITDPVSLMQFASDGDHPAVGTLPPAIDPDTLGRAVTHYEHRIGIYYGLGPSDFERSEAESGYAISLKREAVREAQRRYEPEFRRGDLDLLEKMAAMVNRTPGLCSFAWPESGWGIEYPGLPKTAQEIASSLDQLKTYEEMGLASEVDAYQMIHPGVSREQALKALLTVKEERRKLQAG